MNASACMGYNARIPVNLPFQLRCRDGVGPQVNRIFIQKSKNRRVAQENSQIPVIKNRRSVGKDG